LLEKSPYSDKYFLYRKKILQYLIVSLLLCYYCIYIFIQPFLVFNIVFLFLAVLHLVVFLCCRMSSLAIDDIIEAVTADSDEEFPFKSDEENEINVFRGSCLKVTVPDKGVLLGVL